MKYQNRKKGWFRGREGSDYVLLSSTLTLRVRPFSDLTLENGPSFFTFWSGTHWAFTNTRIIKIAMVSVFSLFLTSKVQKTLKLYYCVWIDKTFEVTVINLRFVNDGI